MITSTSTAIRRMQSRRLTRSFGSAAPRRRRMPGSTSFSSSAKRPKFPPSSSRPISTRPTLLAARPTIRNHSWPAWSRVTASGHFSDIFAENYFPSVPFHGGFGLLNLHGIPKPTYHAFELLHRLGTELLPVEGSHDTVDAWVVRDETGATVLLTNHALPQHAITTEQVRIRLSDVPGSCSAHVARIDDTHANAARVWRDAGASDCPSVSEIERLKEMSRLVKERLPCEGENGIFFA